MDKLRKFCLIHHLISCTYASPQTSSFLGNNSIKQFVARLSQEVWKALQNLNLFPSPSSTNNPLDLQNQRFSTRLFIVTLFLSIITLLVYVSAVTVTKIVTINQPSFEEYIDLYSVQSATLSCPCSKISISHDQFVRVQYNVHQLCRSGFVTDEFQHDFFPFANNTNYYHLEFRALGASVFQSLSIFCQMAKRMITEGLTRLYSTRYVTATVVSAQVFHFQTQAVFDQFLVSATNNLLSTLQTMRDINHLNALFSARFTNYDLNLLNASWESDLQFIISTPFEYSGCSCSRSPRCIQNALFYSDPSSVESSTVPGLLVGCYVTEATLQSTLECFYDETCLTQFLSYLRGNPSIDVFPLDRSLLVRTTVQSTIQELVNYLMVEKWKFSSSFPDYYQQCQPVECIYTKLTRNDVIYTATTLFGIIGGLSTVQRILAPLVVKTIRLIIRRFRRQVTPVMSLT